MKQSEFLYRLGGTAWLLTVGLSLLALVTGWLTGWHLPEYSWRSLWLLGGGGGLASMIAAGVCAIWED
jgi:hypothetical protein